MTRAFAFLCGVLLVCACEPVDIALTDVLSDGGGMTGHRPPPCAESDDCPPHTFCEKQSCGATTGRCIPHPVFCDGAAAPVCGCNGVTYWNECLRRASGIAAQTVGECGAAAAPCSASELCPDSTASCAHILPPATTCHAASFSGTCWVVPHNCPADVPAFRDCSTNACASACQAIRSELPHQRSNSCP